VPPGNGGRRCVLPVQPEAVVGIHPACLPAWALLLVKLYIGGLTASAALAETHAAAHVRLSRQGCCCWGSYPGGGWRVGGLLE
jgi:hypothetical protein